MRSGTLPNMRQKTSNATSADSSSGNPGVRRLEVDLLPAGQLQTETQADWILTHRASPGNQGLMPKGI
jgi:hypothetical protein